MHVPRLRVVAHIDLDAFYCQVEVGRNAALRGEPVAVIQYNPWDTEALKTALRPEDNRIFNDSNGSIIAVSYEARRFGVKRNMSGQQARQLCPHLQLVQVPTAHGKADLGIYRQAGQQVAAILARGSVFERASIDEAYLDLTEAAQRLLAGLDADAAAAAMMSPGKAAAAAAAAGASPAANAEGLRSPGAAGGGSGGGEVGLALPPPPPQLDEWHVKGLEDGDDPLELVAADPDDDDDHDYEQGPPAAKTLPQPQPQPQPGEVAEAAALGLTGPGEDLLPLPATSAAPPVVGALPATAAGALNAPEITPSTTGAGLPPLPVPAIAAPDPDPGAGPSGPTTPTGDDSAAASVVVPTSTAAPAVSDGAQSGRAADEAERTLRLRQQQLARLRAYWQRPAAEWDSYERLLFAGAVVVGQLRAAVLRELGYTCSAGVAHYKLLAKLGSGLHKPNQQTVVLGRAVAGLLRHLPLSKLRSLGGKFGEQVQADLGISTVGELWSVPAARLESLYGQEAAAGLLRLAAGMDDEDVRPRIAPKSLGCGKTFRGSSALTGMAQVSHWLRQLAAELAERIEADRCENERLPSLLTVSLQGGAAASSRAGAGASGAPGAASGVGVGVEPGGGGGSGTNHTRSGRLPRVTVEVIAEEATALVRKWAAERPGWKITSMALTAARFASAPTGPSTITRFLQQPRRASVAATPSSANAAGTTTSMAATSTATAKGEAAGQASEPASTCNGCGRNDSDEGYDEPDKGTHLLGDPTAVGCDSIGVPPSSSTFPPDPGGEPAAVSTAQRGTPNQQQQQQHSRSRPPPPPPSSRPPPKGGQRRRGRGASGPRRQGATGASGGSDLRAMLTAAKRRPQGPEAGSPRKRRSPPIPAGSPDAGAGADVPTEGPGAPQQQCGEAAESLAALPAAASVGLAVAEQQEEEAAWMSWQGEREGEVAGLVVRVDSASVAASVPPAPIDVDAAAGMWWDPEAACRGSAAAASPAVLLKPDPDAEPQVLSPAVTRISTAPQADAAAAEEGEDEAPPVIVRHSRAALAALLLRRQPQPHPWNQQAAVAAQQQQQQLPSSPLSLRRHSAGAAAGAGAGATDDTTPASAGTVPQLQPRQGSPAAPPSHLSHGPSSPPASTAADASLPFAAAAAFGGPCAPCDQDQPLQEEPLQRWQHQDGLPGDPPGGGPAGRSSGFGGTDSGCGGDEAEEVVPETDLEDDDDEGDLGGGDAAVRQDIADIDGAAVPLHADMAGLGQPADAALLGAHWSGWGAAGPGLVGADGGPGGSTARAAGGEEHCGSGSQPPAVSSLQDWLWLSPPADPSQEQQARPQAQLQPQPQRQHHQQDPQQGQQWGQEEAAIGKQQEQMGYHPRLQPNHHHHHDYRPQSCQRRCQQEEGLDGPQRELAPSAPGPEEPPLPGPSPGAGPDARDRDRDLDEVGDQYRNRDSRGSEGRDQHSRDPDRQQDPTSDQQMPGTDPGLLGMAEPFIRDPVGEAGAGAPLPDPAVQVAMHHPLSEDRLQGQQPSQSQRQVHLPEQPQQLQPPELAADAARVTASIEGTAASVARSAISASAASAAASRRPAPPAPWPGPARAASLAAPSVGGLSRASAPAPGPAPGPSGASGEAVVGPSGWSDELQQLQHVDESVLAELPWEIREEIRRSIWATQGRAVSPPGRGTASHQSQPQAQSQQRRQSSSSSQQPQKSGRRGGRGGGRDKRPREGQMDIRKFAKQHQ